MTLDHQQVTTTKMSPPSCDPRVGRTALLVGRLWIGVGYLVRRCGMAPLPTPHILARSPTVHLSRMGWSIFRHHARRPTCSVAGRKSSRPLGPVKPAAKIFRRPALTTVPLAGYGKSSRIHCFNRPHCPASGSTSASGEARPPAATFRLYRGVASHPVRPPRLPPALPPDEWGHPLRRRP